MPGLIKCIQQCKPLFFVLFWGFIFPITKFATAEMLTSTLQKPTGDMVVATSNFYTVYTPNQCWEGYF